MSTKNKTADETKPDPAPVAAVPTAYRECLESRTLKVVISPREHDDNTQELARTIREVSQLEEDKKASAGNYKAKIEEKQARQSRLSRLITDKWDERSTKCHWHFESAGKNTETGELIYHPENKTLIRDDTGEVVEVVAMTKADFEMKELALEGADE